MIKLIIHSLISHNKKIGLYSSPSVFFLVYWSAWRCVMEVKRTTRNTEKKDLKQIAISKNQCSRFLNTIEFTLVIAGKSIILTDWGTYYSSGYGHYLLYLFLFSLYFPIATVLHSNNEHPPSEWSYYLKRKKKKTIESHSSLLQCYRIDDCNNSKIKAKVGMIKHFIYQIFTVSYFYATYLFEFFAKLFEAASDFHFTTQNITLREDMHLNFWDYKGYISLI